MAEPEDGGLLCIDAFDSEEESQADKKPRDGQTEDEFQAVRASYRPKIENGEVSRVEPMQSPNSRPFSSG